MDFPVLLTKKGFSLVELIIVIGIFFLITSVSSAIYTSVRSRSNVEIATDSIVEALRLAKASAEQGNGDMTWGVGISANQITVFAGTSYNARDTAKDSTISLPSGLSVSGLNEVLFAKLTGITSNTGVITVLGSNSSKNISINEKGTLSY